MAWQLQELDSLLLYVTDTHKTAAFYRALGFEVAKEEHDFTLVKLKDFELHCHDKTETTFRNEAEIEPKGAGVYIYVGITGIDDYYVMLVEKGLKPSSEPRDWSWGNREFVIRGPEGYKLVFYEPLIDTK